jgi:hypothetical protein
MRLKKQPAAVMAHPAGLEYLAVANAARVLIPRRSGKGHDVVELRRSPGLDSHRCYLVQANKQSWFSISERQLVSARRFRNVAEWHLAATVRDPEQWPRDLLAMPEDEWRPMIDRLMAILERGGAT